MARAIVITSGKGGVGKTTVTANVGRALAMRGKKTVLIEGDVGLNNLDVVLGVEDRVVFDAGEVVTGRATIAQTLIPVCDKLCLLPATTHSVEILTSDVFVTLTEALKKEFEYVLIDSPAGIEEGFYRSVKGADEALLVCTPHLTSIRDGYKAARFMGSFGIENIGLIVNRVRSEHVLDGSSFRPEEISESMHLPLLGVLPEDDEVNTYGLCELDKMRYAFGLIASNVDKGERKIYDVLSETKGIKNKLKRWLS